MMKWLMVFFAMFAFVSPSLAVGANAGMSAWASVSNQVASSWDQVKEVSQGSSKTWGGSTITIDAIDIPRCVRICVRECTTIISEACDDAGASCKSVARLLCTYICEAVCRNL
jgi:hypothetical protein